MGGGGNEKRPSIAEMDEENGERAGGRERERETEKSTEHILK